MSCNCKGNKYIVETRKVFGEREPRKRDIPLKEKSIVIIKISKRSYTKIHYDMVYDNSFLANNSTDFAFDEQKKAGHF